MLNNSSFISFFITSSYGASYLLLQIMPFFGRIMTITISLFQEFTDQKSIFGRMASNDAKSFVSFWENKML